MSDNCIMCGKAPGTHSFPSGMCMTPDGGTYYTAMKFSGWRTPEEAMGKREYKVPEDGLRAAMMIAPGASEQWNDWLPRALKAFIRWQSENPPVPTLEQAESITLKSYTSDPNLPDHLTTNIKINAMEEWVRRMYLAPQFDPSLGGTLCGRTFTQDEADAIKDYIQMSVKPYTRA